MYKGPCLPPTVTKKTRIYYNEEQINCFNYQHVSIIIGAVYFFQLQLNYLPKHHASQNSTLCTHPFVHMLALINGSLFGGSPSSLKTLFKKSHLCPWSSSISPSTSFLFIIPALSTLSVFVLGVSGTPGQTTSIFRKMKCIACVTCFICIGEVEAANSSQLAFAFIRLTMCFSAAQPDFSALLCPPWMKLVVPVQMWIGSQKQWAATLQGQRIVV